MKPLATVVQIVTLLELGGAQEIVLCFCRQLDRARFRVHLITGRGGLLDRDAIGIPDLEVHFSSDLIRPVRPLTDLRCLRSLTKTLRELRQKSPGPLIVHTHSSKAGILGRWAAFAAGADIRIHSIHGFGFHDRQPWPVRRIYEAAEQLTAPITHAFCPVSEANRRVAERLGLLRGGKPALVLPPGIEVQSYEPRFGEGEVLRCELGVSPETPLVGMLACLKPQKSPVDFVRVAGCVAAAHPQAHFFLAGDGELRTQMETEIRVRGLTERFHLLGWRRDVRGLLAAADVIVLTSLWEGLPRTILQAMAARKPVVASRVDGVPEAVEEGRNGYLLEPHDVNGFAERIGRLIANRDLAREMGEEGYRRLGPFDERKMLQNLVGFYDRLLAGV